MHDLPHRFLRLRYQRPRSCCWVTYLLHSHSGRTLQKFYLVVRSKFCFEHFRYSFKTLKKLLKKGNLFVIRNKRDFKLIKVLQYSTPIRVEDQQLNKIFNFCYWCTSFRVDIWLLSFSSNDQKIVSHLIYSSKIL